MSITALFAALIAAIVIWFFIARQLTAKPWTEQGAPDEMPEDGMFGMSAGRVGLWMFLAVVTSFFGLFLSAYLMRMELDDWLPLLEPGLLWLNTGLLVLSSVAMQRARGAADRGDARTAKSGFITAGLLTLTFLCGQLLVWQQLGESGHYLATTPAASFFYLLTGLHGLHLIGGLYFWGRTTIRMWSGSSRLGEIRLSIELCTTYWHYLLLVWLVLFGLLLST